MMTMMTMTSPPPQASSTDSLALSAGHSLAQGSSVSPVVSVFMFCVLILHVTFILS